MKPMKLEGALKLYGVLYFLAFIFTFLMSIPMLMHVMPKSECLLFVQTSHEQSKKFEYGSPGGETKLSISCMIDYKTFVTQGVWQLGFFH